MQPYKKTGEGRGAKVSQAVHLSTGSHLQARLEPTHKREDDAEIGEGVEDQSDSSEDAETLSQELVELRSVKRWRCQRRSKGC